MIEFVKGNFFDYPASIRVNTVNCVGVMGAGAALQFKNKYPLMFQDYQKACQEGNVKIGVPHVWSENSIFNQNEELTIVNFPTKTHWRKPSEYEYVEKGLIWLKNYLIYNENKTLTLPALGCGHGGLDWSIVKELIKKYLANINTKIYVFEPESSTLKENNADIESKLKSNNVNTILPNSPSYPKKLKGSSNYTIYTQGDFDFSTNHYLSIMVNPKANENEKNAIFLCLENLIKAENINLLLGFNSSIEIDIVKFLLSKKTPVTVLLPYGILEIKLRKDLQPYWDKDLVTLISISTPTNKWNMANAINSLKFRLKLSDIILFTHFEPQPLLKFEKEISENDNQKFFLNYSNNKEEFFNKIHAKKIGKNKETNLPNLEPILSYSKI